MVMSKWQLPWSCPSGSDHGHVQVALPMVMSRMPQVCRKRMALRSAPTCTRRGPGRHGLLLWVAAPREGGVVWRRKRQPTFQHCVDAPCC
eukprot:315316-Chlamydomonas_euryale.AAC.3